MRHSERTVSVVRRKDCVQRLYKEQERMKAEMKEIRSMLEYERDKICSVVRVLQESTT